MCELQPPPRDARIAELRQAIGAIEATSTDVERRPTTATEPEGTAARHRHDGPVQISRGGIPEGEDWMDRLPARYHDGQGGFDRRLMEELAAVGVRCYTINSLINFRTNPRAIPIFIDWLEHLEELIPGPENHHRQAIRVNLIFCLKNSVARGHPEVIDLMIDQLTRRPPLPGSAPDAAGYALARIATKKEFARIAKLIEELPSEVPKGSLIEYMGKVKTPQARDIALHYLDDGWTYFALKALIAMKTPGIHDRIEPYQLDPNAMVRRYARRAMEKLPE